MAAEDPEGEVMGARKAPTPAPDTVISFNKKGHRAARFLRSGWKQDFLFRKALETGQPDTFMNLGVILTEKGMPPDSPTALYMGKTATVDDALRGWVEGIRASGGPKPEAPPAPPPRISGWGWRHFHQARIDLAEKTSPGPAPDLGSTRRVSEALERIASALEEANRITTMGITGEVPKLGVVHGWLVLLRPGVYLAGWDCLEPLETTKNSEALFFRHEVRAASALESARRQCGIPVSASGVVPA